MEKICEVHIFDKYYIYPIFEFLNLMCEFNAFKSKFNENVEVFEKILFWIFQTILERCKKIYKVQNIEHKSFVVQHFTLFQQIIKVTSPK